MSNNAFDIKKLSFSDLQNDYKEKEGLVILGAGGDLNEWIHGITNELHEQKIIDSKNHEIYVLKDEIKILKKYKA